MPSPPRARLEMLARAWRALRAGDLSAAGWKRLGLRLRPGESAALGIAAVHLVSLEQAGCVLAEETGAGAEASVDEAVLDPSRLVEALSCGELTPAGLQQLSVRLPLALADSLPGLLRQELVQRGLFEMAPPTVQPAAPRVARPGTVMGVGPTRTRPLPAPSAPGAVSQGILSVGRRTLVVPAEPGPAAARTADPPDDNLPLIETDGFERRQSTQKDHRPAPPSSADAPVDGPEPDPEDA